MENHTTSSWHAAVRRAAACSARVLCATLLCSAAASAQMPGMGGGMGRGHLSEDSKNQACPPSGPVGRVDPTEDARERLQELRSKINPSAEQIPFWTKYDVAASRAVEDSKRWRSRDHRQDLKRPASELDAMLLDELRDRLTALEDVESTGAALYRTLDASQKELADRQMPAIVSALAGNPVMVFDSE
jgi:hypothetical protein